MAISKFWLDVFGEIMGVSGGGGWSPSNHFWLLKRAVVLSVYNRMNPFWIFYDNSFYTMCPGLKLKNK